MDVVKICGIALSAIVLIILVREYKKEYALLMTITASVFLLIVAISNFNLGIKYLTSIVKESSLGSYSVIMLKALGVSILTQTSSDICKDAGESAIASKIELIGKVEILIMSLPLLKDIIELLRGIMGI